jgi:hypothetical protein
MSPKTDFYFPLSPFFSLNQIAKKASLKREKNTIKELKSTLVKSLRLEKSQQQNLNLIQKIFYPTPYR